MNVKPHPHCVLFLLNETRFHTVCDACMYSRQRTGISCIRHGRFGKVGLLSGRYTHKDSADGISSGKSSAS